jgi:hypothetical protein
MDGASEKCSDSEPEVRKSKRVQRRRLQVPWHFAPPSSSVAS